jgi:LPS-assembly protein
MEKKILRQAQRIIIGLYILFSTNMHAKTLITDDWSPADNLCKGCYKPQAPLITSNNLEINAASANLHLNGKSELKGNVRAQYFNKLLTADYASVTRLNEKFVQVDFKTVSLHQHGFRLDAQQLSLDLTKKTLAAQDLEYRIYSMRARGYALNALLESNDVLTASDASYTTCAPNNTTWVIRADKLIVDRAKASATAHNAKLYLNQTPIFYWPHVSLPLDKARKTGFLQPSFGTSKINGLMVNLPLYFNLAPNYDLLLTTNLLSKRGVKLDNEFRYINKYVKNLNVNYHALPYDLATDSSRAWLKILNHTQVADTHLKIDFASASDNQYYTDFKPDAANALYALQQVSLTHDAPQYILSLETRQYKRFATTALGAPAAQYRKLPELTLATRPTLIGPMLVNTTLQYTNFQKFAGDMLNVAARYYGNLEAATNFRFKNISMRPSAKLNYVAYNTAAHTKCYTTPIFDLYASMTFLNQQFNLGNHIIEPKIYYVNIPKVNKNTHYIFDTKQAMFNYQQLLKYTNYDGIDTVDTSNQISLLLEDRILYHDGRQSVAGIGLRYNFITHKMSKLAIAYDYMLAQNLSALFDVVASDYFSANLQYKIGQTSVLNVGYAYNKQLSDLAMHQLNISAALELAASVDLLTKVEYDFNNKRLLNGAVGFEYQTCCLAFRFIAERNWQFTQFNVAKPKLYDEQFKFQIIFKGLAGVGTATDSHLASIVPGYMPADKRK